MRNLKKRREKPQSFINEYDLSDKTGNNRESGPLEDSLLTR